MSYSLEVENKTKLFRVNNSKNEKIKSWFRSHSRFLCWNEIYNSRFLKNVAMLDFVVLDIDLALSRHCLWSRDYLENALRYTVAFSEKKFLLLACFVVSTCGLYRNTGIPMVDASSSI